MKSKLTKYSILFIIITNIVPFLANLISFFIFFNIILPITITKKNILKGITERFILSDTIYLIFNQIVPFIIPPILVILYLIPIFVSYILNKKDINIINLAKRRIINSPIISSLAGMTGWFIAYINTRILFLIFYKYQNILVFLKHCFIDFFIIFL